jgi:hypothetical protein
MDFNFVNLKELNKRYNNAIFGEPYRDSITVILSTNAQEGLKFIFETIQQINALRGGKKTKKSHKSRKSRKLCKKKTFISRKMRGRRKTRGKR